MAAAATRTKQPTETPNRTMAKRLNVNLDDGTDTWIELSGDLTRRAERLMWEDDLAPQEAVVEVLAEAGLEFD